jgi:hypothetical protein
MCDGQTKKCEVGLWGAVLRGGGAAMCAGVREVVDSACYFVRSSLRRLGTVMRVVMDAAMHSSE